jgi:Fe2+ transport system protein FeoA
LSATGSIYAQNLIGVGFFGGPQVKIAKVDPVTGAPTTLVTTTATSLSAAQAAYDAAQRRVFFQDGGRLFTVNLATNNISLVSEANCCAYLLFDALHNQLLGVGFFGGLQIQVAKIDPVTGTATTLTTTTAATLSGAQAAYDPVQQRVFFQDSSQIFTVNLATNCSSHITEPNCCADLLFDAFRSQLLGVGFFGGSQVTVAQIDPVTGTPTALVTTPANTLSGAQAAYDTVQQIAFFQDGSRLFTVNLATNITSQTSEASCCPSLLFAAPSINVPALGSFALLAIFAVLMFVGALALSKVS